MIERIISWGPAKASTLLVGVFALLHLVVMGQFGLSGDEAHYAMYGFKPALSYFDHPPMVGWLQALVQQLSTSDFAHRVWPLIFSVATAWALYLLSLELFPFHSRWTGFWAVVLMQSALLFHFLALGMVPESPLMFFALMAYRALLKSVDKGKWSDWIALGVWLGLAGLSKYTAVTLVVSVLLLLGIERRWRLLKGVKPWAAVLVAAALVSPVFYWNATHDWLSFEYQLHHGTGGSHWQLSRLLQSQLAQFVSNGPALYLFGIAGLVFAIRHRQESGMVRLLILALPVLLLFAWNSGYVVTLPHWTALGWLALTPAAAIWLMQVWSKWRPLRLAAYLFAAWSLVLILPVFHLQLIHPWLPFAPGKDYLTGEFFGWREAAKRAIELRDEMRHDTDSDAKIFIGSWTLASRLAWYGRPEPIMVTDRRFDQFDIWFGSPGVGESGIFVEWSVFPYPPHSKSRGDYFDNCRRLETQDIMIGSRIGAQFTYYACQGYRP